MKTKLDSTIFLKEMQTAFKRSPLVYSSAKDIVTKLNKYKDKAFNLFKEKNFYDSACIYKALMEKCIEHLDYIDDQEGIIGDFLFQIVDYYGNTIQQAEIDKEDFFEQTINIFLTEDYGFSFVITKLILANVDMDNYEILENLLKRKLATDISKYKKEKIIDLLIKMYDHIQDDQQYLDTCKYFSPDAWERYVYPAEKYEKLGQIEKALASYEEGIRRSTQYKDVLEAKFTKLQKRILGLS